MTAVSFPISLMMLALGQVVLGSVIVVVIIPYVIFPRISVEPSDEWMARVSFMLLWLILAGYTLAASKLLGAVALLVMAALTGWLSRRRSQSRYELRGSTQARASFYDFLSRQMRWNRQQSSGTKMSGWWSPLPSTPGPYIWTLLVLGILLVAGWMRFAPNWHHAGLFFSDAYETVQWVKGIDLGSLFPTGIYPMGYYLVMADIQLLTHANPILFVKFFGALIGTLLTGSVMWSTYRFSGRAVPALVAGAIYGLMPHLLPYYGVRQLAAEGQEFGNMLVLPLAWLVFQAWVTKTRGYVFASSALLAVIGLTHPIALFNAVLAAIAATIGGWLVAGISGRVFKLFLWLVPLAAVISVIPLVVPYALGVPLLSSGVGFLMATGASVSSNPAVILPPVPLMVWIALAGILSLFVTKLLWYDELWEMGLPATAFLLLAFAEGVMQLPRVGISSAVLITRGGEFLALTEVFGIGLGVAGLQEAVERIGVPRSWAAGGALVGAMLSLGLMLKRDVPRPFVGYTMDSDALTRQFVRIDESFPRFSWVAVAHNGYALALNQGYQYEPSFWTAHVSPVSKWPKFHGLSRTPYPVSQRYIFLFVPSHMTLPAGYQPLLSQDYQQKKVLLNWIKEWTRLHGPLSVFYKGPDLTIYQLTNTKNPAL